MTKKSTSKKLLMTFVSVLIVGNVDASNIPPPQNNEDEVISTSISGDNQTGAPSNEIISPWLDISNIKTKIHYGCTVLHLACSAGAPKKVINALIDRGADPNDAINKGNYFLNILSGAISWVASFVISDEQLIKQNNNIINTEDKAGWTALHLAFAHGAPKDVIELLINKGADINKKNNNGETPISILVSQNRDDIVSIINFLGDKIKITKHIIKNYLGNNNNILMWAIRHRKYELAKELINIASKNDINAKTSFDWTALHYACAHDAPIDVIELLIEKGADIEAKSNFRDTPLTLLYRKNKKIFNAIIKRHRHKIDISAHNSAYKANLHELLAKNGSFGTLEYLLP